MLNISNKAGLCTRGALTILAFICLGWFSPVRAETDPKFYAVMVTAQVQSSPAKITLTWSGDARATGYTISRNSGGSWTTVGNVSGTTTSWTDSNVSNGASYEYRVIKSTSAGYKGTGYLLAGINAPLKERHGKVILVVDNTHAADLSAELKRLEWDLAGDGWTVVRRDVSRNDSVPNIKNIIKSEYNADPSNVKAVFLFGHVPVPYSGNFAPDGHGDHNGAWPADMYYGDMDGNWTDSSTYSSGATRPANQNRPGDGKFDQSDMPSDVELAVGRVDMYNMTCFSNKSWSRSEKDLLRAYLNKDHNFRHRVFTVERRGLVSDNFGERGGEAFASSGWRNFGAFFGADQVSRAGYGQYFPTVGSQGYLWSYGTGGGSWYTCNGVGGSDDFATTEIKSVFTMYLGSYFGDWDNESAFLRAALGSGYALTTSWSGRPHWFYHHMGLGEPISVSTVLSQNNRYGGMYEGQNYGTRQVHAALLGDPTLRMHPVIPVSNLRGTASGGSMTLSWNASTDTDLAGYHVYRGAGPNAPFSRISSSLVNGTSFTDSSYSSGATYMVRAVKLERSGGGTYYNASQGVFYPEGGSGTGGTGVGDPTPSPVPGAASNLAAQSAGASQINLTWKDNATTETGFRIERKTGSAGVWTQVGTASVNATSFANSGLAPATAYVYRVIAYNGSGNSNPSNESSATTSGGATAPASATFLTADTATQGNWRGTYGKDGYNIIAHATSYPGYVTVNTSGKTDYQWTTSTTEARALQKVNESTRVAACWYADNTYTIDLNFIDGAAHKFSIYFMDWDRSGRSQKVELLNAATGAVLDTRTVSNFGEGVYLSWNVKGSVRVRLTRIAGANAVAMGLFFDSATAASGGDGGGGIDPAGMVGGKFQLQINGSTGQKFDVYVSEDLSTWTKLSTVTLTSATYNFLDSTSSGKALRFYRAVAAP